MSSKTSAGSRDVNAFNGRVIVEFRAHGGIVTSLPRPTTLLLLTTTGAKTGHRRTVPLAYEHLDGRTYVVGAVLGSARHPDWYRNILADPRVVVEVGADRYETTAHVLTGAARDRIWDRLIDANPDYAAFQARTRRVFPIIELIDPRHSTAAS